MLFHKVVLYDKTKIPLKICSFSIPVLFEEFVRTTLTDPGKNHSSDVVGG